MADTGHKAGKPLLLLVEDERAIRKVMEMVLEGEGYEVITAENGREGLQVLANARPDLIITDYMMPEMNGAEMICEIKNNTVLSSIPILLMSAALPADLPERCVADQFLEKGGDLGALLVIIESFIQRADAPPADDQH
ncbi:MAG TPA: response regulator [Pseudomonas xinjiangensis]|uniref:Response regulator n=2 Tax=root TaxID=1 RepID=A0A7V1BM90_9GAMM|nr:response regulator [Halopseudomonas xinjiangensis]HEC48419.1 response regulator [Halopseudomonas xinjiangensis]